MSTSAGGTTYLLFLYPGILIVAFVMICSFKSGIMTIIKRGVFATLFLVVITGMVSYSTLARIRSNIKVESCNREVSPDKKYMARICYTRRFDIVQVLTIDESSLLAERTFDDHGEPVRLYWDDKELQYLTAEGEGGTVKFEAIRLPPTLYERLLARLP
jgi:hypothetical protein